MALTFVPARRRDSRRHANTGPGSMRMSSNWMQVKRSPKIVVGTKDLRLLMKRTRKRPSSSSRSRFQVHKAPQSWWNMKPICRRSIHGRKRKNQSQYFAQNQDSLRGGLAGNSESILGRFNANPSSSDDRPEPPPQRDSRAD